jgi:hypothetical protein
MIIERTVTEESMTGWSGGVHAAAILAGRSRARLQLLSIP